MTTTWGNQHHSRRAELLRVLGWARKALRSGQSRRMRIYLAQSYLALWRTEYERAPASTRRRWRCGR